MAEGLKSYWDSIDSFVYKSSEDALDFIMSKSNITRRFNIRAKAIEFILAKQELIFKEKKELGAEEEKAQTLAALRETIANAQRIIEENRIKREALLRELEELDDEIKKENIKTPETKIFSISFVKERILSLLKSNKFVSEVEELEISHPNEGEINLSIVVKSIIGANVGVQATLENKKGAIAVKNHKIEANFMIKGKVESAIVPKLGEISKILKEYIEKEEGKKVEKIEIENGQLKVTFQ